MEGALRPAVRGLRALGVAIGSSGAAFAQPDERPPVPPAGEVQPKPAAPNAPRPAPDKQPARHPVICEILYAVPTGESGDANQDGTRHVSGDEFVELFNPHDAPIELFGYTITDMAPRGNQQVRFTFPACALPPGGVAVVFNGNSAVWTGPVGDAKAAPPKGHEKFGGGLVFTMRLSSQRTALGNSSDGVVLRAPDGSIVQRVRWGKAAESGPEEGVAMDEVAPVTSTSSVVRVGEGGGRSGSWRVHADAEIRPFSPGAHPAAPAQAPAAPEKKPA